MTTSGLYIGTVVHTRLRPKRHRLSYRCYWMLLDLDEIATSVSKLRLFSYNRFNLFSLRDRDHGAQASVPLKIQIEQHLREAGIDLVNGKIFLLTMPRLFGYAFNPLSVYYCYGEDGAPAALIYEVHNTFRQRHSYLIAVPPRRGDEIEQACDKRFYVSPFLQMDLKYRFKVMPPDEIVRLSISVSDENNPVLMASLVGTRAELSDANLIKVFFSHPLVTLKVVAAIHWEALRLWLKGVGLHRRPEPPGVPVTTSHMLSKVGD